MNKSGNTPKTRWSDDELFYLEQHMDKLPIQTLAKRLGVQTISVMNKIAEIKTYLTPRPKERKRVDKPVVIKSTWSDKPALKGVYEKVNGPVMVRQMTPEEAERLAKLKPPGKRVDDMTTAPQKKHSRSGGRGRSHA